MSQPSPQASGAVVETTTWGTLDTQVWMATEPSLDRASACAKLEQSEVSVEAAGRRRELVDRAERQGLLFFHAFPRNGTGHPQALGYHEHACPDKSDHHEHGPDRGRQILTRLLCGQVQNFQPVRGDFAMSCESVLDATQQEAVYCALNTPDICLIQGRPGTGKSRVIAEIVTQAAKQGKRVLPWPHPPRPSTGSWNCVPRRFGWWRMAARWIGAPRTPACFAPSAVGGAMNASKTFHP